MAFKRLPRLVCGIKWLDDVLEEWVRAIEGAWNIKVQQGSALRLNTNGDQITLGFVPPKFGVWGNTGTSGFSAGSRTAPSSATVTIYPGFPGANGVSVTAYSVYTGTIAANKTAFFVYADDGKLYVLTADC